MADFRSALDVVVAAVRATLATVPFDAPDTATPSPAAARTRKRANGLMDSSSVLWICRWMQVAPKKFPQRACGAIERAPGTFLSIWTSHARTGEVRYVAASQKSDGTELGAHKRAGVRKRA